MFEWWAGATSIIDYPLTFNAPLVLAIGPRPRYVHIGHMNGNGRIGWRAIMKWMLIGATVGCFSIVPFFTILQVRRWQHFKHSRFLLDYKRLGVWVFGRLGPWMLVFLALGCLGAWAFGRLGAWAIGCLGVWALGRLGA
jgi:hypothetical protein